MYLLFHSMNKNEWYSLIIIKSMNNQSNQMAYEGSYTDTAQLGTDVNIF